MPIIILSLSVILGTIKITNIFSQCSKKSGADVCLSQNLGKNVTLFLKMEIYDAILSADGYNETLNYTK